MKIVLRSWRRVWQSIAFDTETGRGRTRWLRRAPKRCAGWAFEHRGSWYAVWNNGTDLIFQASTLQVEITDEYRCANTLHAGRRTFDVRRADTTLLTVTYRDITPRWDPAFDAMDLEMKDFFIWTCGIWNDESRRRGIVANTAPTSHDRP